MKRLMFALVMLALPALAQAQTPAAPEGMVETLRFAYVDGVPVLPLMQNPPATPGKKFAWDQPATDLAEAQGYTYKHYDDGATTGVAFTGVTCTGAASPFVCEVAIPAYTPGSHTITVTAGNIAGESDKSAPFTFTFVVTPGIPAGIRIK